MTPDTAAPEPAQLPRFDKGLKIALRGLDTKTYDRSGTRLINPTCDLCGKPIRIEDGQRWALVKDLTKQRGWASNAAAAHEVCAEVATTRPRP